MKTKLLIFLLPMISFAQSKKGINETIRIGIDELEKSNTQVAINHLQTALVDSKNQNYTLGVLRSNLYLGETNILIGEYDKASEYLFEVAKDSNSLKWSEQVLLNKNLAHYYSYKSQFSKAEKYYLRCLTYHKQENETLQYIPILTSLSNIYLNSGDYLKARNGFEDAYSLILETKDYTHLGRVFRGLSLIYSMYGNTNEAKDFGFKALELFKSNNSLNGFIGTGYYNMGLLFFKEKKYDSAVMFFKESLQKSNSEISKLSSIANISNSLNYLQQFDSAEKYIQKGFDILKESYPNKLATFYPYKARLHLEKNELDSAVWYATNFISSNSHGDYDESTLELLIDILVKKEDMDSAFHYYNKYIALQNSSIKESKRTDFASYRVRIETLEKEKMINDLESRAHRNQILIIGVTLTAMLIVTVLAIYYRVQKLDNNRKRVHSELERNKYRLQLEEKQRELSDYTLSMIRKNKILDELQEQARLSIRNNSNNWSQVIKTIERNRRAEKEWDDFNKYFGLVHKDFFEKLIKKFPGLTKNELRHAALIKMNMSLKESSEILGVDPNSIKMARFRLKKKLSIEPDVSLGSIICEV